MIYQPSQKSAARLHCAYQMRCGNRSATYDEVVKEVITALRRILSDVKTMLSGNEPAQISTQKTVLDLLHTELNSLETQQERLYEFLEKGIYTSEVFVKRNATLAQRREELMAAISEAELHQETIIDYRERYITLKEAISALENDKISAEEKNHLLRAVIKDIVYHRATPIRDKWHSIPFALDIKLI